MGLKGIHLTATVMRRVCPGIELNAMVIKTHRLQHAVHSHAALVHKNYSFYFRNFNFPGKKQ